MGVLELGKFGGRILDAVSGGGGRRKRNFCACATRTAQAAEVAEGFDRWRRVLFGVTNYN